MGSAPANSVMVWLDPEQVPLMRAAVEAAGLDVVAAGSPRTGRSGEVAAKMGEPAGGGGVAPIDDLRAALASCECAAAVIASPGEFGAHVDGQTGDIKALQACRERGVRVITLEPIPASALQLSLVGWLGEAGGELARLAPLARNASPWLAAADVMADFGPVRAVVFEAWCRPHEGSLGARLLDAMDFVLTVLGEPERIDAAYVWPGGGGAGAAGGNGGGGGLRRVTGDTLRGLQGTLTANLRFGDGRAASLALSDYGARWGRTITLLGPGGRLRVFDDGFEWIDREGARAESSRALGAGRASAERAQSESRSAAVIADALGRTVAGNDGIQPAMDIRGALAMAGAALLSVRTGEGESPDTIRKMAVIPG